MWPTWLYSHPYVYVYALGCVAVVLFMPIKAFLLWALAWITKGNVFRKNIRKLSRPDTDSVVAKASLLVGEVALEVALSWIALLIGVCQLALVLLRVLREAVSSTPEEIKRLRFPLLNNPMLPPELVWAHTTALRIKAGALDCRKVARSLEEIPEQLPSFNSRTALMQLEGLNALPPDWVPELRQCAEKSMKAVIDRALGVHAPPDRPAELDEKLKVFLDHRRD